MSEIKRLLRVAAARNSQREYCEVKVRLTKADRSAFRNRCKEDRVSMCVVMEAIVRGFIHKHPAALAMIDQWVKDEGMEAVVKTGPSLDSREINQLYAEISRMSEIESEEA